jgi:enoyl-[acyl-carrier-protein] reductase (NADH)
MRSARFGRIINVTSLVTRGFAFRVAAAITFLAGEKAGFITGQTLFIDGGASLGSL